MRAEIQSLTCSGDASSFDLEEVRRITGTYAGVCYMSNTFEALKQDADKAIRRANRTIATGHHSVADHFNVSVLLVDIPKAVAMLLNSLGFYTTSEKSGRYTDCKAVLNCEESKEAPWGRKLYSGLSEYWLDVFRKLISDEYKDMDVKQVDKLANENVRYMLSVFAPCTTMVYTTSIRQWNYLLTWIANLAVYVEQHDDVSPFIVRLSAELVKLSEYLQVLVIDGLEDSKRPLFPFLDDLSNTWGKVPLNFSMSYTVRYDCSFVALAQLQRHRTLDYFMSLKREEHDKFDCYVPEILRGTPYEPLWLIDFSKMKDFYPACTLVSVTECGTLPNFILKCEERNCGRTQYETARAVTDMYACFKTLGDSTVREYLSQYGKGIPTKGQLLKGCKEPCYFGCKKGIDFSTRVV